MFSKVADYAEWLKRLAAAQKSKGNPEGRLICYTDYIDQVEYFLWTDHSEESICCHLV
jgi:hypothetical protein